MRNNHEWEIVDDVMVTRTIPGPLSDELYVDGFVGDLRRADAVRVIFSVSTGATSLTATQRKAAAEVMRQNDLGAVVLTDNRLVRGIITAVSWLGANANAFPWTDQGIEKAVAATNASQATQQRLREIATAFRSQYTERAAG